MFRCRNLTGCGPCLIPSFIVRPLLPSTESMRHNEDSRNLWPQVVCRTEEIMKEEIQIVNSSQPSNFSRLSLATI